MDSSIDGAVLAVKNNKNSISNYNFVLFLILAPFLLNKFTIFSQINHQSSLIITLRRFILFSSMSPLLQKQGMFTHLSSNTEIQSSHTKNTRLLLCHNIIHK
ncbi:hypothetical protein AAHE18_01G010700 [Arachis hypogaea]